MRSAKTLRYGTPMTSRHSYEITQWTRARPVTRTETATANANGETATEERQRNGGNRASFARTSNNRH